MSDKSASKGENPHTFLQTSTRASSCGMARDLLLEAMEAQMKEETFARDLMTLPVRSVTWNTPVRDAAAFMLRWGISGAPVADDRGRWIGVFTLKDMARHVQERMVKLPVIDPNDQRTLETRESIPPGFSFEAFEDTRVEDLMTAGLYTVSPETTMDEVVRALVVQKIHRVFVLQGSQLEGVITTMDVMRWLDKRLNGRRPGRELNAVFSSSGEVA